MQSAVAELLFLSAQLDRRALQGVQQPIIQVVPRRLSTAV
jgi:hypothetical protein